MIKKILSSKAFKIILSLLLIYFAFAKVDIFKIIQEMTKVPWWFVAAMMLYLVFAMILGGLRWSLLALPNPGIKDVLIFTKAAYLGGFYSLFFPTMVAGDLMKWLPLLSHYPHLSKTKLLGTVLIDRVVGFSAFVLMGVTSLIVGKVLHYQFPEVLLWLFAGLALGVAVFYILVFTIDFDKVFGRFKFLGKILEIVDFLKAENKKRIFMCFLISVLCEPIWILPVWFYSLIFHVGVGLGHIFIFMPVIALILVLPISIAGFGARENLYLFFLAPLGFAPEGILLMSTFGGIMGIVNGLLGGVLSLFFKL